MGIAYNSNSIQYGIQFSAFITFMVLLLCYIIIVFSVFLGNHRCFVYLVFRLWVYIAYLGSQMF